MMVAQEVALADEEALAVVVAVDEGDPCQQLSRRQVSAVAENRPHSSSGDSHSGMARNMYWSKSGTVKAVSP
jgi:hypothetical protein